MGEIKSRTPKATLIDYNNFEQFFGNSTLLCVDLGVLLILRALVRTRGLWQSTYYQSLLPGNLYEEIEDAQFDTVDAAISKFLENSDMTTCQQLVDLIQSISGGNSSGGCGCGSGGAGAADQPASTEVTGEPGNHTGDPPEGFVDWDDYDDYKCRVVGHILDLWITDLGWMKTANIVALGASGVAIALLIPGPFDDIIAIVGLLIALTLEGVFTSASQDMETAITNNRDDLECALYNAVDAGNASAALDAAIDAAVDATTASAYAPIIKSVLQTMVSYYAINRLFEKFDPWDAAAPANDCSACSGGVLCGDFTLLVGSLVSGSLSSGTSGFTISSAFSNSAGCNREQVQFQMPAGCCVEIDHADNGNQVDKTCADGYAWNAIQCNTLNNLGSSTYVPGSGICLEPLSSFFVRSQTTAPFEITITVIQECTV